VLDVLDVRTVHGETSMRRLLAVHGSDPVLRLTTALTVRAVPLAITYSFFRASEVAWLEAAARRRELASDLVLATTASSSPEPQSRSRQASAAVSRPTARHRASLTRIPRALQRAPRSRRRALPFEVARADTAAISCIPLEVSSGSPRR
jgi:hypothetical protein